MVRVALLCLAAALAACATPAPVPPAPPAAPAPPPPPDAATCCARLCGPCSGIDVFGMLPAEEQERRRAEYEAERVRCLELRGEPCPQCPVCPNG